jgi:hypothetical protein
MTFIEYVEKERLITGVGYLESRGIEVVDGLPQSQDPFPHLIFRRPREGIPDYELSTHFGDQIIYMATRNSGVHINGEYGPLSLSIDDWVSKLRDILTECRKVDGKGFSTKPGEPIKVFVSNPEWKAIADALAKDINHK